MKPGATITGAGGERISVCRLSSLVGALGARPRLMLLVLLATGPLLVLLLVGAATDRRQVLADAHNQAGELAQLGAKPPASPGSRAAGAVPAALDLSWFSEFAARIADKRQRIAIIMNARDGTILARYPNPEKRSARSVPDPRLLASFAANPAGGVAQVAGLDDEDLIVGFAPLPTASAAAPAMLVIGMPRNIVLAAARHRLVIGASLAFAAAAMAFGAAWFVAEFTQIRPLRHLIRNAVLFDSDDLAPRTRMPEWHAPEFRLLAATLRRVADNLSRRAGELAAARADAARSEAELRLLAESCTDVIVHLDADFRRRYVSPACRDLLGYEPAELLGRHPRETVHPDDWPALQAALTCLGKGEQSPGLTYRSRNKNGRYIWLELRGRNLAGDDGYVVVLRDVTLRKHAEEQLAKANRILEMLALQDSLTGLANRRAFDEALLREFRRTVREGASLALLLIDADHFKDYNDIYGHPAGDAALCAIANAVRRSLQRSGDFAARYGGEEIVVLLPSTDHGGAKALAERIRQQVRSLDLEHVGSPHRIVTVSAGAAAIHPPIGGHSRPADLLDAADHALYAAKAYGRDQVRSRLVGPQWVSAATLEDTHPPA